MNIEQKMSLLKDALAELKVEFKDAELTVDTDLETLKLDSLDIVELQMLVEENNNITLKDATNPLKTIKDLLDLIDV